MHMGEIWGMQKSHNLLMGSNLTLSIWGYTQFRQNKRIGSDVLTINHLFYNGIGCNMRKHNKGVYANKHPCNLMTQIA
jgi:hypothetical protein